MSTHDQLVRDATKLRTRALTPEQRKRLEWMTARNEAIQKAAIKAPKSGTFGKGVPDPQK